MYWRVVGLPSWVPFDPLAMLDRSTSTTLGTVTSDDLPDKWRHAFDRYDGIDAPFAQFFARLIRELRPTWEHRVRPVRFWDGLTFAASTLPGPRFDERVEVQWQNVDRISVSLSRAAPMRDSPRLAGYVVVAGDFVRPENAVAVVESFLLQIESEGP